MNKKYLKAVKSSFAHSLLYKKSRWKQERFYTGTDPGHAEGRNHQESYDRDSFLK